MGSALRRITWGMSLTLLFLAFSSSGCISASLATNTGPAAPGRAWCMESNQRVHVGEEVAFDFVLTDAGGAFVHPTGVADYSVVTVGAERREVEFDPEGHFAFTHHFKAVKPGERIRVTIDAYRERGRRDFVQASGRAQTVGRWIVSENSRDEPDQRVAGDAVDLECYQATVDLPVEGTGDDLDLDTGVMRFRKLDGGVVAVYAMRSGRPGFELSERSATGRFRVTFRPDAAMLNPSGSTEVEFSIQDRAGRRVAASATLPTP